MDRTLNKIARDVSTYETIGLLEGHGFKMGEHVWEAHVNGALGMSVEHIYEQGISFSLDEGGIWYVDAKELGKIYKTEKDAIAALKVVRDALYDYFMKDDMWMQELWSAYAKVAPSRFCAIMRKVIREKTGIRMY